MTFMRSIAVFSFAAALCLLTAAPWAVAQETPVPEGSPLPSGYRAYPVPTDGGPAERISQSEDSLPTIMITGYWPPTNEMIRRFSNNAVQNPQGWVGGDWEGRGYNIYAFFPEFPQGVGKGEGDFEVDYQDTSGDWWPLVEVLKPIAIITFSRANTQNGWELEGGNRTYAANQWTNDYLAPLKPTPELPIMIFEPPGTERYSTLPINAIIAAVAASGANVQPFSTVIDTGTFLSNFIGYHGNWYHVLHADPADPAWNIAAGHIHVGMNTNLAAAVQATEVTLRTLTAHVDSVRFLEGDLNCDGDINGLDLGSFAQALVDPAAYHALHPRCSRIAGDITGDLQLTYADVAPFVTLVLAQ